MELKDLGEKRIIDELRRRFTRPHPRVITGIGDDTSVTRQKAGSVLLATTDILVEKVHFSLEYTPPEFIGKKAVSISVSDIAAMGGSPLFLLLSLVLPPETEKSFFDALYDGIDAACADSGCVLVGGNISRSASFCMVSSTLLGEAEPRKVAYRKGARPGDLVYVTGTLGDSALGLEVLKQMGKEALESPLKGPVLRHLDPTPRLEAGRMLVERGLVTSMIDVSDGLLADLGEILRQSRRGAVVEFDRIPLSKEVRKHISERPDSKQLPLSGGEDYELLFTSPEEKSTDVARLSKELGLGITPIGRITDSAQKLTVLDVDGKPMDLRSRGFTHF